MKRSAGNPTLHRRLLAAALLVCAGAPLWLGGCSNTAATTTKGDPLLGDHPKVPPPPAATTGVAHPGPTFAAAPRDGNTPAALVGNTDIPGLAGSRPLTIDPGWQRDYGEKSTGPKVVPVPREKTPTPGLLTTGGAWAASDARVAPVGGDPLAPLTALGAVGVRQETVPEGVRLSCFIPGGTTPGNLTYLETTAPSLPLAVEAMVQKVGR